MLSTILPQDSLKTRITVTILSVFLVSLWSLSFYASKLLHDDMERVLGEQQFSTASMVATQINDELDIRFESLEKIAVLSAPAMLDGPEAMQAALQDFLQQRFLLHSNFNGGVVAYQRDGTAIADVPRAPGRVGVNHMDIDAVATALKDGKSSISQPHRPKGQQSPEFSLVVPIRDNFGLVIGALAGVVDLDLPNSLDTLTGESYGKTGGYVLVDPKHRLIVTATDRSRIMEASPAPGLNPVIDRFLRGYEGSAVYVNPKGVEVLQSAKGVPVAGWYVAASLPTDEAFAPIRDMQQRMRLATIFLTLLAALLIWWVLRRQLSPLLVTAKRLATMPLGSKPLQPLPIARRDEIGQLIGGFNTLLESLERQGTDLRESEERFRALHNASFGGIAIHDRGIILDSNQGLAEMFGYSNVELIGLDGLKLIAPEWRELVRRNIQNGFEQAYEVKGLHRDGSRMQISIRGNNVPYKGRTVRVTEFRDISERKRAEQHQRIAAIAFESQEGMFITDAEQVIIRVNKAFSEITGYPAEEAVGQTLRLLHSGRHDAAFYDAMMQSIADNGTWRGETWNKRKHGEVYAVWLTVTAVKDDAGGTTNYVVTLVDITARKLAEDEIKHLAFYDQLTGLPNRRLLVDRLEQSLATHARHQREGALLFIDLDNFKVINDTLGHDKGDLLLQQVAQRLVNCVREGDTVARLGGDEFVVMLEDLSKTGQEAANQAETVGEKVLAALNLPYQLIGCEHHNTASIGITLFADRHEDVDELLKRSDLAMYQAKSAGRNTLRFFDPEMQAVVTARAALEAGLREAIQKEQFLLHYQAQVDSRARVIGAEVLLRWQPPERSLVYPGGFISLSEETGLILPIGQWVLETACRQLAIWSTRPGMEKLTIAVNVSARQFHHEGFVNHLLASLKRSEANPHRLKLELTESLLITNVEDIIAKMTALKTIGVSFAMDDFGTGYSSLSYLKRLPLDQLKIDQSFIRDVLVDPDDAAIAKLIVDLGKSLGLGVIAEGVETEEQRDFLSRQGCHLYQGYLFSRPLPLNEFEAFYEVSQDQSETRAGTRK